MGTNWGIANGVQWGPTGANARSQLLLQVFKDGWGLYGFCSWVSTACYYVFLLFRGLHCKYVLMNMHIYRIL
jgi:hypothetical protein